MIRRGTSIALLAGGITGAYLTRNYIRGGQFTEAVSASGKVAVVTGANTGIGLETVRELNRRGAKVYMLCRNEERAAAAMRELERSGCDGARLVYVNCDLACMDNVRKCAADISQLEPSIDILVNNAGLTLNKYQQTRDGHEMTWATNHLGPFLLTELLLPRLQSAPHGGRIVIVASRGHAKSPAIDLDTVDDSEGYDGRAAYYRSKLANVMHSRELARRLRTSGQTNVTVNSLHPGVIATEITRDMNLFFKALAFLAYPFVKTWRDGAQTSLYLALSTEVDGVSGQYFSDCARKEVAPLALDDLACKRLYEHSLRAVGLDKTAEEQPGI